MSKQTLSECVEFVMLGLQFLGLCLFISLQILALVIGFWLWSIDIGWSLGWLALYAIIGRALIWVIYGDIQKELIDLVR